MNQAIHGYAEGYYGHLLSWSDRMQVLEAMHAHHQNTYYYAPKEDVCHRLLWRKPYDGDWRSGFRSFCEQAGERGIGVVGGIAPGMDFDYRHLQGGSDLQALVNKGQVFLDDGAHSVSLLMDDIDADYHLRNAGIRSEGRAHAMLANRLGEALGIDLWVTPRIYANELSGSAPDYLADFLAVLDERHTVLYCGSDIIARKASPLDIHKVAPASNHRMVVWDNLYANDYCPQRLFLGAWSGREEAHDVLLNPTGMVNTDCLLLDMMASFRADTAASGRQGLSNDQPDACSSDQTILPDLRQASPDSIWWQVMQRHGIPQVFEHIAPHVWHPVFNGTRQTHNASPTPELMQAIEECLWRWKSPLSREWYPILFGLKLDLMLQQGTMTPLRMRKVFNAALVERLTCASSDGT